MNLQFHYIEKLWLSFWNSKSSSDGPTSLPARYCLPLGPQMWPSSAARVYPADHPQTHALAFQELALRHPRARLVSG